jgi:F-type H+-transporting ATPase subunit gamma
LRATAAGRIQGAQRVLSATQKYYAIVLRALGALPIEVGAGRRVPLDRSIGLLVLSSEQPLCGALSQNIVDFAERRRHELIGTLPIGEASAEAVPRGATPGPARVVLLVVGRRGARQFTVRGVIPDGFEPAATSLAGLRDVVKRVAETLAQRYARGEFSEVRVIYSRYVSVGEQVPTEEQLLPPDLAALHDLESDEKHERGHTRRPYFYYLPPEELLEGLLAEYVLIVLYRIAAEMFASEQAARLVAMDAATRSAERMLERLKSEESRARQEEITTQVLELIGARFASEA